MNKSLYEKSKLAHTSTDFTSDIFWPIHFHLIFAHVSSALKSLFVRCEDHCMLLYSSSSLS